MITPRPVDSPSGALLYSVLALLLPLATAPPALGQDVDTGWLDKRSYAEVGFVYGFETDVDDGEFDTVGGFGRALVAMDFTEDLTLLSFGSYYGLDYTFDDRPTISNMSVDPWDTVHSARLYPVLELAVAENWYVFAAPVIEVAFENSAAIEDGIKPGALAGFRVELSDELMLGLGVVAVDDLEADAYVQPILLADWNPHEQFSVHAESWTTRGGELDIAYRPIGWLELAARAEWRRERFRLSESNVFPAPNMPVSQPGSEGVGEDRALEVGVRVSHTLQADWVTEALGQVRIDLEAGAAVAGRLKVESDGNNTLFKESYDPAPFVGLNISLAL